MLGDKEYIRFSLQAGLISAKLAFDHIIFLEITASEYTPFLQKAKKEYTDILLILLDLADNKVEQSFIDSAALVTDYTKELEGKTRRLFKVKIDEEITNKSLKLKAGEIKKPKELIPIIERINITLIKLFTESIESIERLKEMVLEGNFVLDCSFKYLDHYIKETELFIYNLETIELHSKGSPTYAYNCKYYFNETMKEHCEFIEDNTSIININLIKENYNFLEEFEENLMEFNNKITPYNIDFINLKTSLIVDRFKYFEEEIIKNLLSNNYSPIIIPLYYDHLLRESNAILRNLKLLKAVNKI